MRFKKAYVEITDICNLSCAFCPGTKRKKAMMTEDEFSLVLKKLRPFTDHIYLHIMGEPLLHPDLPAFLDVAAKQDFRVVVTTNGTLLGERGEALLSCAAVKKVNISVHSFEASKQSVTLDGYLEGCLSFAKMAEGRKIIALRLWNSGGMDEKNGEIIDIIRRFFSDPWEKSRTGVCIGKNIFIEYGEKFDWPDIELTTENEKVFCYGLRDQIGVLCDGTVVPCCLDKDGNLALGNIFSENLEDILVKPRAKAIYDGFSRRTAVEELCRKCGYAKRFG
jgi:radical SAM protein with 4Fe4S-binding SPASM domain